jgi:hypothetical protein
MVIPTAGDIVAVPFPFTDLTSWSLANFRITGVIAVASQARVGMKKRQRPVTSKKLDEVKAAVVQLLA